MKNRAEFIVRKFEELGLVLNPTSRLARQIDAYLDRKGTLPQIIEPGHPLFWTAVEAYRDLNQVAFSLEQLWPLIPSEEMKKRLHRLIKDSVLPEESPDHSPGRDSQCELFIAALCAKAGLQTVFDESPDLHCTLSTQKFGVAIKRIKAPPEHFDARFEQHARKAIQQVTRSQLAGIIVTDISQSLNPTNRRIPLEVSDAQFDLAWNQYTVKLKRRFEAQLLNWTKGTSVRGIIFVDHILRCLPTGWRMELFGSSINLCPHNQRRRREFEFFDAEFKRALCNPGEFRPAITNET